MQYKQMAQDGPRRWATTTERHQALYIVNSESEIIMVMRKGEEKEKGTRRDSQFRGVGFQVRLDLGLADLGRTR
jgi:hypothetical protein